MATVLAFGSFTLTGCTKKPSQQELGKLEEAKNAAEAAEKKLGELKAQRMALEQELEKKKEELRKAQEERDAVKQKIGQ
jgi:chromosome segregation ATPase